MDNVTNKRRFLVTISVNSYLWKYIKKFGRLKSCWINCLFFRTVHNIAVFTLNGKHEFCSEHPLKWFSHANFPQYKRRSNFSPLFSSRVTILYIKRNKIISFTFSSPTRVGTFARLQILLLKKLNAFTFCIPFRTVRCLWHYLFWFST